MRSVAGREKMNPACDASQDFGTDKLFAIREMYEMPGSLVGSRRAG
jgi:hypothetical protein